MRLNAGWPSALTLLALLASACDAGRDFRHDFVALGTVVTVTAYGVHEQEFRSATDSIEAYFARIGNEWYVDTPGELRRANEAIAAGQPVKVSAALKELIEAATVYESLSDGLFNICIGRTIRLWGFYAATPQPAQVPDPAQIKALLASGPGTAQLSWDGLTLRSANPDIRLDVGGIAKGAIALNANRILRAHGIDNAIVNIGGDLAVAGQVNGRDARIGIRSPDGGPPLAMLDVHSGEAVFTSGNYERFVEIDGQRYTHILDPTTGRPVEHTASVTVVHTDPVLADAAATALLVGGPERFAALVTRFELRYALLIDKGGDTSLTSGMAERLHWAEPFQERAVTGPGT